MRLFIKIKKRKLWLVIGIIMGFQCQTVAQSQTEYFSREVSVKSDHATIKGTLYLPPKDESFPVMVIVPGSGRVTRQDLGFALTIFQGLDIGTFIYDKRGLGESTGEYLNINASNSIEAFEQRAKDVSAIVNELKKQENVNPEKIGMVGSSQGSWIIPMVASRIDNIALTVCISGAVSSVGLSDYYESLAEGTYSIDDAIEKLAEFSGEHGFDPYESIQKMANPGLWIYGGEDRSNPTHNDIRILKEMKKADNKPFTIQYFPTYNHEMVDTTTESLGEEFIPAMREWIVKVLYE